MMTNANVYFDLYGAQVQSQETYGNRLTGLYDTITDAGYSYSVGSGAISTSALSGFNVLVLTTRMQQPYSTDELSAITEFVTNGGGLWCMANHAGFNLVKINDNFLRYVSSVSSTFWTSYEAAAYQRPDNSEVNLTGSNLADHPTITGESGWPVVSGGSSTTVSTVATRSFCGVYPNNFSDPVCNLVSVSGVLNLQDNQPITDGVVWAVGIDQTGSAGSGRAIICGDSGWLGNDSSNKPGTGQYQNGDNAQYALNTLTWLAGN